MVVFSKSPDIKDKNDFSRQAIGRMGESAVKNLLISKGFTLIEANYRQKCGELDLIMARNDIVSFFEVKTVSRERFLPSFSRETHRPEDNVHTSKTRKIAKTIRVWLARHALGESKDWNFNVACVYFSCQEGKFYVKFLWDIVL